MESVAFAIAWMLEDTLCHHTMYTTQFIHSSKKLLELLKLKLESERLVRATVKHWQHRRRFRFDSCPSSC